MTCGRNEAKAAYDAVVEENKRLKAKLEQYDKPEDSSVLNDRFEKEIWEPYGKIGSKKIAFARWKRLSTVQQGEAACYIKGYVKATPKGSIPQRRRCEVYISKETWYDTLPEPTNQYGKPDVARSSAYNVETQEDLELVAKKARIAKELREVNKGMNIRDRLNSNSRDNA